MNPHPPNTSRQEPFDDLLDAVVSGDASAHDNTLLNNTLRANPAARRAYIHTMAFEAMVAREFAPPEDALAPPAPTRHHRGLTPLAIAATIMLASALGWYLHPTPLAPASASDALMDEDQEITHAVITSLDEADGRFGNVALTQGLRLSEGLLVLDRGLAEITFDTGAELTLEGPARLHLEAANRTRLDAGRASAQVPEQARGFVILTPSSSIRDLGTALAVEVGDNRETDLHVLEGEVEVVATGRDASYPPQILRQREAVRLAGGHMRAISFRSDNPGEKRRQHPPKIPPAVHWSFDTWDGSTTTDPGTGRCLKLQQKNGPAPLETLDGPFGLALHFDGQGTFARAEDPATNTQARTVACWIRLQPDDSTTSRQPNGIISWGAKRSSGKWQVAWNTAQGQGTVGAPRVEYGNGFIIGSTDLRDGRWHHLAVVYLGGHKPNIGSNVKIYVDGRLETLSGRRQRRIDTDPTATAARPFTLGRALGQGADRSGGFFTGDLDEVHIFEGVLLPGQITRLMKRNNLRPAKP